MKYSKGKIIKSTNCEIQENYLYCIKLISHCPLKITTGTDKNGKLTTRALLFSTIIHKNIEYWQTYYVTTQISLKKLPQSVNTNPRAAVNGWERRGGAAASRAPAAQPARPTRVYCVSVPRATLGPIVTRPVKDISAGSKFFFIGKRFERIMQRRYNTMFVDKLWVKFGTYLSIASSIASDSDRDENVSSCCRKLMLLWHNRFVFCYINGDLNEMDWNSRNLS